jgi:hypothetical protein
MSERRRRDQRRPGVRVVLEPRDGALMRALARFRAARSADLARLFFAGKSRERGSQRLRQLFDAQFLDLRMGRLSEANIYSLGPRGRQWAEERDIRVGRVPAGGLDHHLATVKCWSGLAAALGASSDLRLLRFQPDWEVRADLGSSLPVIPDALIEVAVGAEERIRVALEVDLGTEFLKVFREKITRYVELRATSPELLSWPDFTLVVVALAGGEQRHRNLAETVTVGWPGRSLVLREPEWPVSLIARFAREALPTTSSSSRNSVTSARLDAAATSALEEEGHSG